MVCLAYVHTVHVYGIWEYVYRIYVYIDATIYVRIHIYIYVYIYIYIYISNYVIHVYVQTLFDWPM